MKGIEGGEPEPCCLFRSGCLAWWQSCP